MHFIKKITVLLRHIILKTKLILTLVCVFLFLFIIIKYLNTFPMKSTFIFFSYSIFFENSILFLLDNFFLVHAIMKRCLNPFVFHVRIWNFCQFPLQSNHLNFFHVLYGWDYVDYFQLMMLSWQRFGPHGLSMQNLLLG